MRSSGIRASAPPGAGNEKTTERTRYSENMRENHRSTQMLRGKPVSAPLSHPFYSTVLAILLNKTLPSHPEMPPLYLARKYFGDFSAFCAHNPSRETIYPSAWHEMQYTYPRLKIIPASSSFSRIAQVQLHTRRREVPRAFAPPCNAGKRSAKAAPVSKRTNMARTFLQTT